MVWKDTEKVCDFDPPAGPSFHKWDYHLYKCIAVVIHLFLLVIETAFQCTLGFMFQEMLIEGCLFPFIAGTELSGTYFPPYSIIIS